MQTTGPLFLWKTKFLEQRAGWAEEFILSFRKRDGFGKDLKQDLQIVKSHVRIWELRVNMWTWYSVIPDMKKAIIIENYWLVTLCYIVHWLIFLWKFLFKISEITRYDWTSRMYFYPGAPDKICWDDKVPFLWVTYHFNLTSE